MQIGYRLNIPTADFFVSIIMSCRNFLKILTAPFSMPDICVDAVITFQHNTKRAIGSKRTVV